MASNRTRRFPRASRILHTRDFGRLKIQGERMASGALLINWLDAGEDQPTRIGIITTKRLGNAVVRNRARRLIREAFRHLRLEFTRNVELVVVARPSIVRKDADRVARDLQRFALKVGLIPESMP